MNTKTRLRALPANPEADLEDVPRLLTYEQTAVALGCGRTRVYELVKGGDLTAIRIGKTPMIPAEDISALISDRIAAAKKSKVSA